MRWDNLRIETAEGAGEQTALPGYRDPANVRRFDAPEALNTRFYEIRAKSALNRVPEQSQVPFRWTVNPYRGCTHACLLLPRPGDAGAAGRRYAGAHRRVAHRREGRRHRP